MRRSQGGEKGIFTSLGHNLEATCGMSERMRNALLNLEDPGLVGSVGGCGAERRAFHARG